ncbi:MAG: site-2 protease family protein [Chloroflexota bacterium]
MSRFTPQIARIAAVPIRIHWGWGVISVIVIVLLHSFYRAQVNDINAWFAATSMALLLFLSVLLHECGHALAARRCGVPVRSITIYALGGITEIVKDPPTSRDDFFINIMGPLVSLVLTVLGGLCWWLGVSPFISLLGAQLFMINGIILVFNLLPGYPLDGGRIVRAVLWFLFNDELRASKSTTRIAQMSGWAFMFVTILYALMTSDIVNSLWGAIIGYFLVHTAKSGHQQLLIRRTLNGVSVADLMLRVYPAVKPDISLEQFVGKFLLGQTNQGFPVIYAPDQDIPQPLLGMISVRDLRRFTTHKWSLTYVQEAMTPVDHLYTLAPNTPASDAVRMFLDSKEDQIPVLDGDTFLGILRRRDMVRYIQMELNRLMPRS